MSTSPFPIVELSEPAFERDGLRVATAMSPSLGRRADVTFFAPDDLPTGSPLIVLLHGVFSSHWGWTLRGGAHLIADGLIRGGEIRPLVLAMPSDGLRALGSGYIRHQDEDVEAWIRDEVPTLARLLFPQLGDAVCIAGLSMGGYGALRAAALAPERYVAAAGTSSATTLATLMPFIGATNASSDRETLLDLLSSSSGRIPLRFDCGLADELLDENRMLHQGLLERGIEHEYAEFPGGHDWVYWSERLPEILRFFERALEVRERAPGRDTR